VTREPRPGEECVDVNKPTNNVYGEKYPVNYSIPVSNDYDDDDDDITLVIITRNLS